MSTPRSGGKTLHLTGHGGYDKMKVVQLEKPQPGKGEVLINIHATGINFAELMCRQGMYDRSPKLPAVLGLEGAGEVVSLGEGCQKLKPGARVLCISNFGLWSEFAVVPENQAFVIPDQMTYEEAAAIPVNYITAYHMLFEFGNLRPGKSVLIHMAAGGVGIAATQLCRTVDNVTVFGTSSESKHGIIKDYGVTHPIDYRTKDYYQEVRKISPKGVDIVLDPLNGPDAVKGYNLLKPFGKIIHFGAANTVTGPQRNLWQVVKTWWGSKNYNPIFMISSNKQVAGYHLGFLVDYPELIEEAVEELMQMYQKSLIKPHIDSTWAYEDVAKAMARMHERKNVGKVILSPQKEPEK